MSAMGSSKIMSNRMSLDPKQKNNLLNREKEKRMTLTCTLKNLKNKLNLAILHMLRV